MDKVSFNPAGMAVNLVIGWFFAALLQTFVFGLATGKWREFSPHFQGIAFFKDGNGVMINLGMIAFFGIAGTVLWFLLKK